LAAAALPGAAATAWGFTDATVAVQPKGAGVNGGLGYRHRKGRWAWRGAWKQQVYLNTSISSKYLFLSGKCICGRPPFHSACWQRLLCLAPLPQLGALLMPPWPFNQKVAWRGAWKQQVYLNTSISSKYLFLSGNAYCSLKPRSILPVGSGCFAWRRCHSLGLY
jgi:hypothetical protein